ncbi:MAG TPA: hypothetical protein VGH88_18075 [Streptosporangiaceae bacterium]
MVTNLVLGIAVLGLLIYRQLMPRRVSASSLRIMAILAVIGVVQLVGFLQKQHGGTTTVAEALGGSLVLALVFGALRARATRIWQQDGAAWSQGSWLTAGLWVAALAAHLGYDALLDHHHGTAGLGEATLVLYLAISLGAQRLIVMARARGPLPPGSPAPIPGLGQGRTAGR